MTTNAPPPVWDPLHPEFRADPYPWYEALRNADPVHRIDDYTVVLTRHDDVLRTLRGPEFARDIEQHAAAPINDPVMQRRRQRSVRGRTR